MDWRGDAIIVGVRKHGETSSIIDVFSEERGLHSGLVRGGVSRRIRPILQCGNSVEVEWRARLDNHLGYFSVEPTDLRAAQLMYDRLALMGLNAACAIARQVLPERQPFSELYQAFQILIDNLEDIEIWPALFVRWEIGLLEALGYGLDFSRCAATGQTDELTYVSPRSGRAVSRDAGEPYKTKLYELPGFLTGVPDISPISLGQGFALSGYFLESRVMWAINKPLPDARTRMVEALAREGHVELCHNPHDT